MIRELHLFSTISRTLSYAAGVLVVTDLDGEKFKAAIDPPRSTGKESDGSPRDAPAHRLRWRGGPLGLDPSRVKAGYRVTVKRPLPGLNFAEETYEVLGGAEYLPDRNEYKANVLPTEKLYPEQSMFTAQDGTLLGFFRYALWAKADIHLDTGSYEDFDGEADPVGNGIITQNTYFVVGGSRYRITSALTDREAPRVRFVARRTDEDA